MTRLLVPVIAFTAEVAVLGQGGRMSRKSNRAGSKWQTVPNCVSVDNSAFNRIVLLGVNSGLTQTGVAQYHRSGQ